MKLDLSCFSTFEIALENIKREVRDEGEVECYCMTKELRTALIDAGYYIERNFPTLDGPSMDVVSRK